MRAFPVRLPSGARYWTVLDEDLAVVAVADGFLRQVRFGRDGAESTTKSYAHSIALFLRWCARTGRTWQAGAEQLGLFMTWLAHAGPAVSGAEPLRSGMVLAGPGQRPGPRRPPDQRRADRGAGHGGARGRRRAGGAGIWCRCCMRSPTTGTCPEAARGEDGRMSWRMRARHRLHEPETPGRPGRATAISSRCCGRAGRRGTG